jgi:signal transduction histidine kinase
VARFFSFLRPSMQVPSHYERQVFISNVLSLILAFVTLGIVAIFYGLFGWIDSLPYVLLVALLFLIVPGLNRYHHRTGRMTFCLIPVWFTIFITIYFKFAVNTRTEIAYYDSRFILMATTILPGIVFRLEERIHLLICLGSTSVCLLFFDPIHELFGAGYFQQGFHDPSYNYINYIVSVTYVVLLFGILLLRSVMERSEESLKQQNRELQEKQNEIEAQHEELLQQQEEVLSSSEKLEEANLVILKQQDKLETYNQTLEGLVEEKSEELVRTNEELVRHNNDLLQFSYTVSHNLRGPVARLLGLTRLLQTTDNKEEKGRMEDLVLKSSQELDEILRDLSLIIDLRNDLYRVREKIVLLDEWNKAISLLGESVKSIFSLKVDFSEAPFVFGVRPMIQSIFYNLASNAIKYQSPSRKLHLTVTSVKLSGLQTKIEVRDNGLGIDLKTQGKNVFKLYKRFHHHVSGKGLGLYLVKSQTEAMDATISIYSEPDKGTAFELIFTQPEEVNHQVFHDSEAAQLYFDAHLGTTVILWKRHITSKEYRETFEVLLSSLKVYNTPGWIADVRRQGTVSDEDQQWFVQHITREAIKNGLKRVAVVAFQDIKDSAYYQRMEAVSQTLGISIQVFNSMEDASGWMEQFV